MTESVRLTSGVLFGVVSTRHDAASSTDGSSRQPGYPWHRVVARDEDPTRGVAESFGETPKQGFVPLAME